MLKGLQFDLLDTTIGAILGAVISVPVGLWVAGLYDKLKLRRKLLENAIEITSPLQDQSMQDAVPMFPSNPFSSKLYPVTGKLSYLAPSEEIWLLVQEPLSGAIWPQGHKKVTYNGSSGTWSGFIRADQGRVTIVAVVAPSFSSKLFDHYERNGKSTNRWDPLPEIPPECKNRATVRSIA